MATKRLFKGQRLCTECGSWCWADEDRNWEEATRQANAASLDNPGRDAWEKALEARDIKEGSDLCGRCLLDLWGQAWSFRKREERAEDRARAQRLRHQKAEEEQRSRWADAAVEAIASRDGGSDLEELKRLTKIREVSQSRGVYAPLEPSLSVLSLPKPPTAGDE